MELGNLCPDLIQAILHRLPLIHLTRSKLVSKTWCNFITHLRHSTPLTTSTGLVLFLRQTNMNPTLHESTFITVQEETPQAQLRSTLHLSSTTHTFPYLIDSYNGLLLYAAHDGHYWTYYISSPVFNRCIALPRAHELCRTARESIFFDGYGSNYFKVVCHFWKEIDHEAGTISCKIFSTRTWEWREKQARIIKSYLLRDDNFMQSDCFQPSVCFKGKLYWIWSICMLVYEDGRETFRLIELPKTKSLHRTPPQRKNLSRLLWESEGLVHYCDLIDEGFYVWTYDDEYDEVDHYDYESMDYSSRWRFKWHIVLDQQRKSRWGNGINTIKPCAFNEDLQVLYLQLPESIVAYSFETGEWVEVWNFGKQGENYFMCTIYPFLFNSVDFLLSRK